MPSTPVHFPAQLAKRCGAVAGSVASAPSTGTVSTGTSVVVVSVGGGAGASAFSQPASHTSAAALAMITIFCIMRLRPTPNAPASQIGRGHDRERGGQQLGSPLVPGILQKTSKY